MKKLSLLVLLLLCCDVFSMNDSERLGLLECSPSIHVINEAESRLNQQYDEKLWDDVFTVLSYLRNLGWRDDEMARLYYVSDATDISDMLDKEICGDLLGRIHRYYVVGGESVIGLKPPHERKTNWLAAFSSCLPWWCGKPNEGHGHIKAH